MQRYAFEIQYNGKNFVGWQIQPNGNSVQATIEKTLNKLFNSSNISIVGCGRTDAGVHANHYIFHVNLEEKYDLEQLKFKVNRMLPLEINVIKVFVAKEDFHARFDAKERAYRYFIHAEKNPFKIDFSLFYPKKLDLVQMNLACEILLGKQDFTSFSKLHTDVKTNICTINYAKWVQSSENEFYFEISADRFLRNMVRAIVGTLIEVGLGHLDSQDVKSIIAQKDRGAAKHSVPSQGLFLWRIEYDFQ